MNIKWIWGRKTYYLFSVIWAIFAVANYIEGSLAIAVLDTLLALICWADARSGKEVVMFELNVSRKGRD
jgi:hypothetical protein